MMRLLLLFNIIFLSGINSELMAQHSIEGEYSFRKMEMVAGFNFTKDGKFQFYYSYGAVDRFATGTYDIIEDTLKLNSDKTAGQDFEIVKQLKKEGPIEIKFSAPNPYLLSNIQCICFEKETSYNFESDPNGIIQTDRAHCDKIFVQHQLYPDIYSLIKDESNSNNYFELSLKPSLQQVSFKGIDFIINGDELTCLPNYFMPFENIRFIKNQ